MKNEDRKRWDELAAWAADAFGVPAGQFAGDVIRGEIERLRDTLAADIRFGSFSFKAAHISHETILRSPDGEQIVKATVATPDGFLLTMHISCIGGNAGVAPFGRDFATAMGTGMADIEQLIERKRAGKLPADAPIKYPDEMRHVAPGEFVTLKDAEQEINRLRGLLCGDAEILQLSKERNEIQLWLGKHWAVRMLCCQFVDMFEESGAANILYFEMTNPKTGGRFEITMQPKDRKSPGTIITEQRALLERARNLLADRLDIAEICDEEKLLWMQLNAMLATQNVLPEGKDNGQEVKQ